MQRLDNKKAVVTGAASGIGEAAAIMFAQAGADVIAVDVNDDKLSAMVDKMVECRHSGRQSLRPVCLDITQPEAVEAFAQNVGGIQILFNCAGKVCHGDVLNCSPQDWRSSFELNVDAIYYLIRAFLPTMIDAGGGSIINMASVISSLRSAPDRFAYGASKAAVIGLTKSTARDYAAQGIRCNAICPSAVDTPSMRARIEQMDDPVAALSMFNARQPVGRMAKADEIAKLALYLAGDDSKFVTGSALVIDGGTTA